MKGKSSWIVGLVVLAIAAGAYAQDTAAMIQAINQKMSELQGQVAKLQAEQQNRAALDAETQRILGQMKAAAGAGAPVGWLENLTFYGDLLMRYEAICYGAQERFPGWLAPTGANKWEHRMAFRLRFGFLKTWLDDQVAVNFRLATGSAAFNPQGIINRFPSPVRLEGPITTREQPFTGAFSEKPIWVDLAYATFKPKSIPGVAVMVGKMPNPLKTSWVFIDEDVTPEGIWAQWQGSMGPITPFAGVGYFILEDVAQAASDAYDTILMAYQAGADIDLPADMKLTVAANIWDYDHYDAIAPAGWGLPAGSSIVPAGGNNDLSYDFFVFALHTKLATNCMGVPVALTADWAHNCRENEDRTFDDQEACAVALGVTIGKNEKAGDWTVGYTWARLDANALPAALTDAYFGFGTAIWPVAWQGHVVKGTYRIRDFLTAAASIYITEPGVSDVGPLDDVVRMQFDLLWEF